MDEDKIEAAAKAFLAGLFTGASQIQIKKVELGEEAGGAVVWTISLITMGSPSS